MQCIKSGNEINAEDDINMTAVSTISFKVRGDLHVGFYCSPAVTDFFFINNHISVSQHGILVFTIATTKFELLRKKRPRKIKNKSS